MRRTVALVLGSAVLAAAAAGGAGLFAAASPATAASAATAHPAAAGHSASGAAGTVPQRAEAVTVSAPDQAGAAVTPRRAGVATSAHRVVLVGVPGLRWSDVSATATPALWRLATAGSVGSLVVSGVTTRSCPADGWLTLNAGARAAAQRPASGQCAALPDVTYLATAGSAGKPTPAQVPSMPAQVSYNKQFHYNPRWGLLASAAGPRQCATAVGPGAALALASRAGQVSSFLPAASALSRQDLARCPLTVVDLGALPSAAGPGAGHAASASQPGITEIRSTATRAAQVRADDQEIGRISAELAPGTILVVAAPGDDSAPHLRLIIVSGPGYHSGLLHAASTRQPGMTLITDLTRSVLGWRGRPVPSDVVGSQLTRASRASLGSAIRGLIGQDTAAQVYKATVTWFFIIVGFGYAAFFGLVAVLPWGRGENRGRRRRAVARVAGICAASIPAGTFLASLVPWWTHGHPAVLLYAMAVIWAAVIAAIALTGPWRRDPLGPPGVVAAVTVGVIALDVMTGSRLQMGTPFGLSALAAGRFYGLGNNALGIYGTSGILCAAWLGIAAWRRGSRSGGVLAAAAVALVAVIAAGWPGFGAKVGGTIAMVPGFLLLLAALAGISITARRAVIAAVSGLALVTVFALVNYFVPITGHSDIGGFVGQALHGGAGGILQRKINSNVGSLTVNLGALVVPVVVVVLGLALAWPARFRAGLLVRAYQEIPLLRTVFGAIWLVAVLGWFADDSGVTVPAAELPLILPLVIAILSARPPAVHPGAAAKAIFDLPSRFAPRGGIG